jgi:hypothetical protein
MFVKTHFSIPRRPGLLDVTLLTISDERGYIRLSFWIKLVMNRDWQM